MNNFFTTRPSQRTVILLLVALLVLAAGLWLSRYFEWKIEELDLGQSDTARKDQFLAAQRFLALQGVRGQTLRSFSLLDNLRWQDEQLNVDDTLILLNAHKLLKDQRFTALLDWVGRGGTVIASTDNVFIGNNTETRDLLLEHFELEVVRVDDDEDVADGEQPDADDTATSALDDDEESDPAEAADLTEEEKIAADLHLRCEFLSNIVDVNFAQEKDPLQIDYGGGTSFNFYGEEPESWSGDDDGVHLAAFTWGNGRVIINSDNHIWNNRRIDCHDHAYALWKLINPNGKVWFLVNQDAPSLWSVLWQSTPYGALAALLALALWLWAKAVRFGPILTRTDSGRRSLAEHIHASATLLWRRQQHPYLVTLLRNELQQNLRYHFPQFDSWSAAEQIAHLQTLTTLSETELETALFSNQLQSPQDFTAAVALLQTIRKSI